AVRAGDRAGAPLVHEAAPRAAHGGVTPAAQKNRRATCAARRFHCVSAVLLPRSTLLPRLRSRAGFPAARFSARRLPAARFPAAGLLAAGLLAAGLPAARLA